MLRISDVTDERTSGRSEDGDGDDTPKTLVTDELTQHVTVKKTIDSVHTYPSADTVLLAPEEAPDVLETPLEVLQTKSIHKRPHKAKRRLRRLPQKLRKWFTHELPFLRSPRLIRAMPRRDRLHFYLSRPEESRIGWRVQHIVLVLVIVNVGVMASETVDGPRYGSTDPDFPNMLSDSAYQGIEALFTLLYAVEFAARCLTAPRQTFFWKSISTWISFLAAIAAIPKLVLLATDYDSSLADFFMYNLRIFRVVRLVVLAYAYVGTKILFQAAMDAIPPLIITLFFLITVVMIFATAIFYAEPCYDLQTCTFTDIFNTGYFVMLTVATVGYGSQVPSMHNPGSLFLVCVIMIFGTFYFSMPLAIIGIKYELAWSDFDEFVKTRNLELLKKPKNPPLRQKSSSKLSTDTSRGQLLNIDAAAEDASLEKIAAYSQVRETVTCDRFYQLSQKILNLNATLQGIVSRSTNASDAPPTLESIIQTTKRRSDEASQALDELMSVIKLHGRVCSEAHELLLSKGPSAGLDRFLATMSGHLASKNNSSELGSHVSTMSRAKGAIATLGSKAMKAMTHDDQHADPTSLRAIIWNTFKHRHDIWLPRVVNRVRMGVVVLSIVTFYLQTTPELQKTGVQTFLCQRNIHDFCQVYDEPGCYVFKEVAGSGSGISVQVSEQRLNLDCSIGASDESCYASGVNYGSANFPLSCSEVFTSKPATEHVCQNRLCNPPVQFVFDMEPYWVYFEFFFGITFTLEIALRVYSHPVRRHLWGNMSLLGGVIILLPFYAEVVTLLAGEWPTYSVVPTMPSVFSALRILKSLRILKLGEHIPGSRVLINTTRLISKKIVIPLFFLFLGCVVSAAVFFEMERGTECFVGSACLWWRKNVLTPEMSAGLPMGKRVLVQNTLLTIIIDMLRSTWFSLVSFTTVGYGDLYPRTTLGKLIDIIGMIFSSCYTAMPLTLVGGQFYVCYELHAQEQLRQKEMRQRVEPNVAANVVMVHNALQALRSTRSVREKYTPRESEKVTPFVDAERTDTITSMAPRAVHTIPPNALPAAPHVVKREDDSSTPHQYTRSTELQITNHFFLMQKVFNEAVKDISILNRLGVQRINLARKASITPSELAALLADVRRREEEMETKIMENMDFCVTACLNFAAMIETIQEPRKSKQRPSIVHTNALLASADPTGELLQNSVPRRRSIIDMIGGEPSLEPASTDLQPKHASFKRVATLSKVFVSPILQNQKWADKSNKKDQQQRQPTRKS